MEKETRLNRPEEIPRPPEALVPSLGVSDPMIAAQDREQAQRLQSAYELMLQWVPFALEQLSSRDRYVLTAIHVHGARYREVEEELGLRAGALKMIVHRARSRFQLALQGIGRGY